MRSVVVITGACPVMLRSSCLFVAVLTSLFLAACTSYQPAPPAMHAALEQPYLLDSGYRIRVTVFGQDGLNNTYSVDQSGYISFPLVGAIPARGHTAKQMEAAIAAKLRKGYIRDPDVTVEVDRYRPVFVMGEVGAAGQYSYVPGMTAQNAVAIAGGFTSRANQKDVDVTRKVNGQVITGRNAVATPVMAGDTIYVRERLF